MIDEDQFIIQVQQNDRIIHKVVGLYADTTADKEDLYQECLLQLWKASQKYRGDASFSTFMYKIALNVALNFRRSADKHETDELAEVSLQSTETKEDYELLYIIIKRLQKSDRMIITLHLDGYTNEEISDIVGITRNNVNVKIHRIKDRITQQYERFSHGYQ